MNTSESNLNSKGTVFSYFNYIHTHNTIVSDEPIRICSIHVKIVVSEETGHLQKNSNTLCAKSPQ